MKKTARRIVVVTSRFPFGSQEAYLSAELEELTQYFDEVVVAPVRPPGVTAESTSSPEVSKFWLGR